MTAGTETWVASEYADRVSTQSYGPRRRIDGVQVIDLALFSDEGGDFCELCRFTPDGELEAVPGYRPRQTSYSLMEPGTIKAFHLHREQDDLWFVPPASRLLVGLLDVRSDAPTSSVSMRFVMGAGKARLVLIPRGVAHGVANLSSEVASIIYFANNTFNAEQPDEHRLPADLMGTDFWSIRPG